MEDGAHARSQRRVDELMMDQADTLRNLLGRKTPVLQPVMGLAGRPEASLLAAALVDEAALEGSGGVVLDTSRDALVEAFNLKKRWDLCHYLSGDVSAQSLLLSWAQHRHLVPSARGIHQVGIGQVFNRSRLQKLLSGFAENGHEMYVTLAYEQSGMALSLCADAPQWLWLVEPSRASVTECYKALTQIGPVCGNMVHRVLVCRARGAGEADDVFAELEQATRHQLAQPLEYAGQYRGPSCARTLRARSRLEAII